jgi:hypothetical protein
VISYSGSLGFREIIRECLTYRGAERYRRRVERRAAALDVDMVVRVSRRA